MASYAYRRGTLVNVEVVFVFLSQNLAKLVVKCMSCRGFSLTVGANERVFSAVSGFIWLGVGGYDVRQVPDGQGHLSLRWWCKLGANITLQTYGFLLFLVWISYDILLQPFLWPDVDSPWMCLCDRFIMYRANPYCNFFLKCHLLLASSYNSHSGA